MKILKSLMFLMIVALLFGACNDDNDPSVAVTENSVPDGIIQQKYIYTVHVIASSENGRIAGLKNATVTVSQNANVKSVKVNESGEAVFTDLTAGNVTVYVKADGFASYNETGVTLTPSASEQALIDKGNDGEHEIEISRSTVVTLPRLGASIKGIILGDFDKSAATAEAPAAGFKVRLQYPTAVQPNLFFTTVAADGSFEFTNVPESTTGAITLSTDTILTIAGQGYRFTSSTTVTPKVGGITVAVIKSTNADPATISFTGTLKFKPWADFDFVSPNPLGTFQQTSETTPSTVVFTIDYSADGTYPKNLNPVFSGTRDAVTGAWTFANLPTGSYNGKIKYSYTISTYNEDAAGALVIPATGVTFNAATPYTTSTSANPTAYTRTITWNGFAGSDAVNIANPNETLDKGAVQLAQ